tara:strand:- start:76 stop:930 length:855 start_codon:yes stop_codon:yes gene_type:complete
MKARWELLLIPPFIVTLVLTAASQFFLAKNSLYKDLGLGLVNDTLQLTNYIRYFTDTFYLKSLWVTIEISVMAAFFTLLFSYPVAYVIARMKSKWAMVMLAAIISSSFITIVIKVFGLIIIFAADGWLNRFLMWSGLRDSPFTIVGSEAGVVVGLMHFSLGFGVLILYSVVQTIPKSLEEASQVHGASRFRTFWRVVLPLSIPGVTIGGLMLFNLCMGAFTSASLLGGGFVFTLPVLIQRTVIMESKYSMGGTLAMVLLVVVVLINLLSLFLLRRMRVTKQVIS